jgi:putative DNA primase/helicase
MIMQAIPSAERVGTPGITCGPPMPRRVIRSRILRRPFSLGAGAIDDRYIERARASRIEDVIAARNIRLRRSGAELIGPCPNCGGDDRFSVNLKKQVFNCRKCEKGGDAIELIQFLDGVEFPAAIETLTGQAPVYKNGNGADHGAQIKSVLSEAFDYEDETGALLFQAMRFEYQNTDGSFVLADTGKRKKTFRQRQPDPARAGQWLYNLDNVRRVLYRLPELLEDLSLGHAVIIVEGERKVNLLRGWNVPATCNPMGAEKWTDDYSATLSGADVIILPDNDEQGHKHLDKVAASLAQVGANVRTLDLPGLGPKGDIVDWAKAGGTVEQLHELIEREAMAWEPSAEPFETAEIRKAEPPSSIEIITLKGSDIRPEPIDWVWKYWLARWKLHILAGVPEAGKTTIALSLAAIISVGGKWPDGTIFAIPGNVLIWTSEDDPSDTLIPRLIRMGANLDRIYFIKETRQSGKKPRPFDPATDLDALDAKARAIGDVVLLIIDSVVSAVPATRNSHNNVETRSGLQPVVDLAKSTHIAAIGIMHLTKGTIGKDPLERLAGSLAFGALPRLVMFAAKNNAIGDDEPERIMTRVKSNIGPSDGGFGYHIDMAHLQERPDIEATRVVWESPLEGTARELLNDAEGEQEDSGVTKLEGAKRFLRAALANGERPQKEVEAAALADGISAGTLKRASQSGEIGKRKDGCWYWWLT